MEKDSTFLEEIIVEFSRYTARNLNDYCLNSTSLNIGRKKFAMTKIYG